MSGRDRERERETHQKSFFPLLLEHLSPLIIVFWPPPPTEKQKAFSFGRDDDDFSFPSRTSLSLSLSLLLLLLRGEEHILLSRTGGGGGVPNPLLQ